MVYASCIISGCRRRRTSPLYCFDHDRQRISDDLRLSGMSASRAWIQANFVAKRKHKRRLSRRKAPYRIRGRSARQRRADYRKAGFCPCGRQPRRGLKNCNKCIRNKNPLGKVKSEDVFQRARRQKRYREKKRRLGICIRCTNKAHIDDGRQLSLCLPHLRGGFVSLRKKKRDALVERVSLKGQLRKSFDDVESSGDFEAGDLISAPT